MEYGGKENLDHRAFWYCQCPPNTLRGRKKHYRTAFGISARVKTQSFALTCWHSLTAPLSPAEQQQVTGTWFGALQLRSRPGRAVPGLSRVRPHSALCRALCSLGCGPEHRALIHVLPVSLREAWRQRKPCRKEYMENSVYWKLTKKLFRVEESRGFSFPVMRLLFQKLALAVIKWSEGWSEILSFGKIRTFWTILLL